MTDHSPHQRADDPRLVTIRNLLAKAEATEFPDEAEAFFNKASELIARYSLDEAMVWASASSHGREEPEELRLEIHSPYLTQKSVLVGAVASAHGCRTVRLSRGRGERSEIVSIVGFPSELRWVDTIFTSLIVQLTSAMLSGSPAGLTPSASAAWRRSFIMGFAQEVSDRLEEDRRAAAAQTDAAQREATSSPGASVSVVLASRADEVDADFRRRYPRVRTSWASSGRSRAGEKAGRAAGRSASLDRRKLGNRRRELRAG